MGRLTKENKNQLLFLKKEISSYKHGLINIEKEIRKISEKEANRLGSIIGRLEDFQCR
jgi:flagellar motility protein MotE (MotC chaperone)